MPETRKPHSVRMSDAGAEKIQQVADRDGLSWNEAARRLLKWATSGDHPMPKGWH